MKRVIALMDFIVSPLSTAKGDIKEGETYTVKNEHYGYSSFAKRWVYSYEFYETTGFYEQGIFVPLSNIDEMNLCELLHSEPNVKVSDTSKAQ